MTPEGLLRSALLSGLQMTRPQIEKCLSAEQIPFPTEGKKGKRVLKPDLVDTLLAHVLSDVPEEQVAQIRRRLCREPSPQDEEDPDDEGENDASECPVALLRVLNSLDTDNKQHFKEVISHAGKLLQKRTEKEMATRSRAAREPAPAAASAEASAAAPAEAPAAAPAEAPAPEGDLPARDHEGSHAARPRVNRRLTPESLKTLLPPLDEDKVYLKWKSKSSQIQVEFLSILALGFSRG